MNQSTQLSGINKVAFNNFYRRSWNKDVAVDANPLQAFSGAKVSLIKS
jgi:hypothetical protein